MRLDKFNRKQPRSKLFGIKTTQTLKGLQNGGLERSLDEVFGRQDGLPLEPRPRKQKEKAPFTIRIHPSNTPPWNKEAAIKKGKYKKIVLARLVITKKNS